VQAAQPPSESPVVDRPVVDRPVVDRFEHDGNERSEVERGAIEPGAIEPEGTGPGGPVLSRGQARDLVGALTAGGVGAAALLPSVLEDYRITRAILDGSGAGIAVLDPDLRFLYVNEALAAINGVAASGWLTYCRTSTSNRWIRHCARCLGTVGRSSPP
jgi:PAS domain-containing protein